MNPDNTISLVARPSRRAYETARLSVERRIASAALRVERLPRWTWALFAGLAAWPSLAWTIRRFADGSDDPLGIVALAALGLALVVSRERFGREPRVSFLVASAAAALGAAWPGLALPDLARALVSTTAVVFALAAIVDEDEPFAPYAGLAFLALPLLSSLQFYAGFPLRVVTAEASRWLLMAAGSVVERTGSALMVDGRLVLVDAPCSGVQMAWVGYFTACASAWLFRVSNRAALARLPIVGMAVLAGNIVRNTILVAMEASGDAVATSTHEAIGLNVLAVVAIAIVVAFARCDDRVRPLQRVRLAGPGRFYAPARTRPATALLGVTVAFALAALLPLTRSIARTPPSSAIEWPTTFEGAPLVPVALSDVESRFVASFPGSIARFTNGDRVVVLRDVEKPTRRLHPSADCYRALGYGITAERLERAADASMWRCFTARRGGPGGGTALRVCERIVDAKGDAFTDVSSWYWSAALSRSVGPWRAMTIAVPLAGAAS